MNKIFIELEEETTIATVKVNQNNICNTRYLNIEDLIEVLSASKVSFNMNKKLMLDNVTYDTGEMPSSNGASIQRIIEYENETKLVVVKKEKCNHDFVYHKTTFSNVGIPSLLFFFRINKNNIIYNSKVFAIKDKNITERTRLYKYPFTNVYASGEICFGANKDNLSIEEYSNLLYLPDKFLMMPSTHDLNFESIFDLSYRDYIDMLQDMSFEDEFLISTNKKYIDLINEKY